LQDIEGFFSEEQCLEFAGTLLEDRCTLRDYKIENKMRLHLVLVQYPIYIIRSAAETITLQVLSSDSVGMTMCQLKVSNWFMLTLLQCMGLLSCCTKLFYSMLPTVISLGCWRPFKATYQLSPSYFTVAG
jgi:hypothetical protein